MKTILKKLGIGTRVDNDSAQMTVTLFHKLVIGVTVSSTLMYTETFDPNRQHVDIFSVGFVRHIGMNYTSICLTIPFALFSASWINKVAETTE